MVFLVGGGEERFEGSEIYGGILMDLSRHGWSRCSSLPDLNRQQRAGDGQLINYIRN
jgi:hypothetical protein